jgi:hypothetical protein
MIRSAFVVQPSGFWLDFALPFSCPFDATSGGKRVQNAAYRESENRLTLLSEARGSANKSNEQQMAAPDVFSAC